MSIAFHCDSKMTKAVHGLGFEVRGAWTPSDVLSVNRSLLLGVVGILLDELELLHHRGNPATKIYS